MKRIFAVAFVLLFIIGIFSSCAEEQAVDSDLPVLATIETSEKKSYLNYYNASADILSSTQLECPKLGTYLEPAVYTGDKVFVVSDGEYRESRMDTVVVFDMKTKEATELSLSFPSIYAMYAQGDVVYTITGIDYVSTLTRFDSLTGEKKEFTLDGFGMSFVYAYGDTVYLIEADTAEEVYAKLYLLDEKTLEVKKTYDVKNYMFMVNDMLVLDGILYIAPLSKLREDNLEMFVNTLVTLDLESGEFNEIAMRSEYPCHNIIPYEDGLVISSTNPITYKGQDITVYNLKENKLRTKAVDLPTVRLQVKGDRLYQLTEENINVYKINKSKLSKIKTVDNCIRDGYVTTTFFVF